MYLDESLRETLCIFISAERMTSLDFTFNANLFPYLGCNRWPVRSGMGYIKASFVHYS